MCCRCEKSAARRSPSSLSLKECFCEAAHVLALTLRTQTPHTHTQSSLRAQDFTRYSSGSCNSHQTSTQANTNRRRSRCSVCTVQMNVLSIRQVYSGTNKTECGFRAVKMSFLCSPEPGADSDGDSLFTFLCHRLKTSVKSLQMLFL